MDAKQFLKEKGISNNDFMDSGVADLIETLLTEYQALQLQQTGVNGSFFKCTCLHPQSNCFSGKCSYCNRTIKKDITTDDL